MNSAVLAGGSLRSVHSSHETFRLVVVTLILQTRVAVLVKAHLMLG
jgi:hypothetical protein